MDRLEQINALVAAQKDVQNKIDHMFSEDLQAFSYAIRNMAQIDLPQLNSILADALHMNLHASESVASRTSNHVHELMFALDKFIDSSPLRVDSNSKMDEDNDADLQQPQKRIKSV